jgi:hypothetical protein
MNKRTLRNVAALVLAAASASPETPWLSGDAFAEPAAESAAPSRDIVAAVNQVVANASRSYPGFDTNIYPGDRAMDAWKRSGEYEWVGYYLKAPCHTDKSWSGKRARLIASGWGLAVIYVGQQTWGQTLTPASRSAKSAAATTKAKRAAASKRAKRKARVRAMSRQSTAPVAKPGAQCSAAFVDGTHGALDALHAIHQTTAEGFPNGSVIFLDVEYMTSVPRLMRDYYRAWTRTVLADGRFQPGIYAHTRNAATIYSDVNEVYDQAGIEAEPPFWIAGAGGFSPKRPPTDVGHSFASAWQGALDVVRTHNGVKLPIDISVASVASPSLSATQ